MRRAMNMRACIALLLAFLFAACEEDGTAPTDPLRSQAQSSQASASNVLRATALGPQTPPFNLEVILNGSNGGFGLVKFRQPNDTVLIIFFDVLVRGLAPNTNYVLQRAVNDDPNGDCIDMGWLTLGQGTTPQPIVTDDQGMGRAELWRNVSAHAVGSVIHVRFRVLDQATQAIALESDCYRFIITP